MSSAFLLTYTLSDATNCSMIISPARPSVRIRQYFARGVDLVIVREPEPPPPLIDAGISVDRGPTFDIVNGA